MMKKNFVGRFSLIIFVLFLMGFNNICYAATINQEENFLVQLIQSVNFVTQPKKPVWPNYTINEKPTIVHFSNGHIYALHFNPISSDWQKKIIHGEVVYFLAHDKYGIDSVPFSFDMI